MLIALIYIISCLRRRKANSSPNRKDSYDFIDDAPPRFSPFHYGPKDPRGPLGGFAHPRIELPSEKNRETSEWYREQFPNPSMPVYGKRSSHLAGFGTRHSPLVQPSNESMRTISQLLPDKPGSTPPAPRPPPPRPQRSRPASMASPATIFEEDRSPRVTSTQQPKMPRLPLPVRTSISGLPGKAVKQTPQFAAQYTRSPEDIRAPALSLEIPRQASRTARIPSPTVFPPPPVPIDEPLSSGRASRSSKAKSGASSTGGSLLNYYASPEAGSVPDFWQPEPTPISNEPMRHGRPKPAAITVTKPTYQPRAVRTRSDSAASDTSFESTDPDEPTPPDEEDKQLSPVAEHSPIAAIRYPKIPRSSNQSIPRSPPVKLSPGFARALSAQTKDERARLPSQKRRKGSKSIHSPITPERQRADSATLSGSTLATKRRGDSVEKRLYIDTSHSRANSHTNVRSPPRRVSGDDREEAASRRTQRSNSKESPLKGYGRVTSTGSRHSQHARRGSNSLLTPEMQTPGPKFVKGAVGQEVCMKSPLWQPKLTPSRKGDDLFLQVGLASPTPVTATEPRRAF